MAAALRKLIFALACAAPVVGSAQAQDSAPAGQHTVSRFRDPEDGQFDVGRFLAHPRSFLPIPLVVTEPAVGYGGGVAGLFVRPRESAGEDGFARPNISMLGGIATENGTWMAFAGDSSHWYDERLQTLAAGGGGKLNLDFYGLGENRASLDQPISYSLETSLVLLQGNWKLTPRSPWSVGLRYVYSQVEPQLRDAPANVPGLLDDVKIKISAPTAVLEFDSRNNLFTPTRGVYSESSYMDSLEELGATESFQRFEQTLMGWIPISDKLILGLRGDYQWSSDGTPFFLRPYIQLRGVAAMRYQGDEMASVEAEARWQFRGRWSLVGAAGYGTAHTERELFSATREVWSGAVGFRYELARLFGMHAGLDVGFSEGESAIYLQVGSAWFRP
jgi:hypothetical protein